MSEGGSGVRYERAAWRRPKGEPQRTTACGVFGSHDHKKMTTNLTLEGFPEWSEEIRPLKSYLLLGAKVS